MTLFIISDTHFGHANIIDYTKRPFTSVDEMDEAMVSRWNAIVRPSDHVYHLGDVAMRRDALGVIKRLNGHKRLIFGNHDIYDYKTYAKAGFQKLAGMRVLDGLIMTHVPIHPESLGRFKANVHGHIHERDPFGPRYFNASVERINYTPISLEEIKEQLR